jgi:putative DNA primase/helicase
MPKIDDELIIPDTNGQIKFNSGAIPYELCQLPRWVGWKSVPNDDPKAKPSKVPVDVKTGRNASSTDPDTWVSFREAEKALKERGYAGLMFAIHPDDGYVFIDLDECRNPKSNAPNAQAKEILRLLNSYSEVSPSGTGVHILVKGKKPGARCRSNKVEMYDHDRFAAMTGRVMPSWGTKIEARQQELELVYAKYVDTGTTQSTVPPADEVPLPEKKLKVLLTDSKAEELFKGTFDGQYPSQSEADWHLCKLALGRGWNEAEMTSLLRQARKNAGAGEKYPSYFQLTIHRARGTPVDLATAHAVFKQYLHFPDLTILDVTLAVVASGAMPGDPCWLHLVGPPGTGKTEAITAVSGWPCVYPLSELTPAGLVSGRDSDDGKDHSLLPQLHCKTLAIKDFTPVLEMSKEQQQRLFSRLRDAFDGSQSIHTAMVGTRTHKGTFNSLTGVTSAIDRLGRNTSLGERYLLYRHPATDPIKSATLALQKANEKEHMRKELARVACGVLAGVDQDCMPECPQEIREKIVRLATLLATLRTYVERDGNHKILAIPQPEGPSRIALQLYKLGQGLALINHRAEITPADLSILTRVALDSMPPMRRKAFDLLVRSFRNKERAATTDFMKHMGLSQGTVHEQLDNLCLLGVCNKETKMNRSNYWLAGEIRQLVAGLDLSGGGVIS